MKTVNIKVENYENTFNEQVSSTHFGTIFENRGQTVDHDSPVISVLEKLDVEYLRYPGGSQTEIFFDPASPNNTRHVNIFKESSTASFEPIDKFIAYASENSIKPIIVLPTFRYFDKNSVQNDYITEEAEAQIEKFVTDLVSGVHGDIEIAAIEIGNEWFNSRMLYNASTNPLGWSAEEFGILQGRIVEIVENAISAVNPNYEPQIWVQSGQQGSTDIDKSGISDNREILAGIDHNTMTFVDGVVDHFYQPTRGSTPMEVIDNGWVASTRANRLINNGWDVGPAGQLDLITTEWNVRAARNGKQSGDDANITGFERLPLVLGMFADMIAAGVDYAMIYTAQALGANGGSGTLSRFGETNLTPTGLLFDMMSKSLRGTQLLDANGDQKLSVDDYVVTDTTGQESGLSFSFVGSGKYVLYVSSVVDHEVTYSIDGLDAFLYTGMELEALRLRPSNGENPTNAAVDGRIDVIPFTELDGIGEGDGILELTLGAYELVQLTFSSPNNSSEDIFFPPGSGVSLPPVEDIPAANGWIDGSPENDLIDSNYVDVSGERAGSIADRIRGLAGEDTLYGNNGNDIIEGGADNDVILGGAGDDVIYSGAELENFYGRDTVYGDDGNDTLIGSNGGDWLHGGLGNDEITGGQDFSSAKRDYLYGNQGNDYIRSGQTTTPSSAIYQMRGDYLSGGSGNDTLESGKANDVLNGGYGADIFVFTNQFGRDTIEDFETTRGGEKIDLSGVSSITSYSDLRQNHMRQAGNNVIIDAGSDDVITILNVKMSEIYSTDFIL
ncbi:MAG: calcium-binding protein [Pseudorhodobacter sp.]